MDDGRWILSSIVRSRVYSFTRDVSVGAGHRACPCLEHPYLIGNPNRAGTVACPYGYCDGENQKTLVRSDAS